MKGKGKKGTSGTKKNGKNTGANKKSKKILSIIAGIAIVLFGIWYFFGKPVLVQSEEGSISLVQTEKPLAEQVLKGEITLEEAMDPEFQSEKENLAEEKKAPVSKTSSSTGVKSASGTSGSNAECDLGHEENSPLYIGNPSDATSDISNDENYLMVKPQFTLSYNTETMNPNWVAWHLSEDDFGDADRSNDFRADEELPEGWYGVKKADYNYNTYGFDRGHVCPSADRTKTQEDNSMTFLMTNMVPQSPDNNRVIWNHFEAYERDLVLEGNEMYIISGPYGTGGTGAKGSFDSIEFTDKKTKKSYSMNVPASTWKVIVVIPHGEDDISRIDENTTTIAINVPNSMGIAKDGDWEQYITTIDEIESLTGYDFFELLPDHIEDKIESSVYQK